MGDAKSDPVGLSFNPQLRIEGRGATVTSDAGPDATANPPSQISSAGPSPAA